MTLTRVGEADLARIAEQRLSPLYVSIHAVDPEIRKMLLGIRNDDHLLEKLRYLASHGIELHGQIVLCPGINDGEVLTGSLETLARFYPDLRSMAVVPVGLTRHRHGLPVLSPVDSAVAARTAKQIQSLQRKFKKKLGEPFIYLADEFYLLSGERLPPDRHYGDFWQSGNGVGMTRRFLTVFREASRRFPLKLEDIKRYTIVTGMLAGPVIEKEILPVLRRIKNLDVEVHKVRNRFFGDTVTVSGLLTGGDIADALRRHTEDRVLLLPDNCLNTDGRFLDGGTPRTLENELKRKIVVLDDFNTFWERS